MPQDTAQHPFVAAHPRLVYGCMRIAGDGSAESDGRRAVRAAIDAGFTHFDHADIYGDGACERLFGSVLRDSPGLRDSLTLIGKCGIRFAGDPVPSAPKRYDFSAQHLEAAVDGSLARLGTDRLDALLLHRPDYLMDPDEVCEVFVRLHDAGKVLHVGVSNFSPTQIALLQSRCPLPLVANQIEVNLANPAALDDGTLDQCLQLGLVPQAWSPLRGALPHATHSAALEAELARQAAHYAVEPWLVALAWLLRHPARCAAIVGSQNPARIAAAHRAEALHYSRADWYRLLEARYEKPVP